MGNIHTFSSHFLLKSSFNAAPTNATQAGVAVDTQGFRRAALIVDAVTGSATTVQVTVTECDTVGGSYTAAITGSANPAVAQPASTPASGVAGAPYITNIDLSKRKRFLKANVVGTGTAGSVTADFLLYEPFIGAPTEDNTVVTI